MKGKFVLDFFFWVLEKIGEVFLCTAKPEKDEEDCRKRIAEETKKQREEREWYRKKNTRR